MGSVARFADLQEGDVFGAYRIGPMLGEGGMGQVFRAAREDDGTVVALKVLKGTLAHDDEHARRFVREARAAREVTHRHLVEVLDAGEVDGRRYLASRYVDGTSLEAHLRTSGPLPVREAVSIAVHVASGLDALHGAGLVHRDVKPSNILLDLEHGAALTDFGLAKRGDYTALTRQGQLMGTIGYIAPEALAEGESGSSSDIYGLGCVVFECLAGRRPFVGRSPMEVLFGHLHDAPPDPCADRPDAPPHLGEFVVKALEKEPARRPPTAMAYANVLLAVVGAD